MAKTHTCHSAVRYAFIILMTRVWNTVSQYGSSHLTASARAALVQSQYTLTILSTYHAYLSPYLANSLAMALDVLSLSNNVRLHVSESSSTSF
jgi:hypothetical protein